MKKTLLFLSTLLLIGCGNDYYSGDERIVIEGKVAKNGTALSRANISVYPSYKEPNSAVIAEIGPGNPDNNYDYSYNQISSIKTDAEGKFSISIPRNKNTHAYFIRIDKDTIHKDYGYISDYNVRDYYINLGSLTL